VLYIKHSRTISSLYIEAHCPRAVFSGSLTDRLLMNFICEVGGPMWFTECSLVVFFAKCWQTDWQITLKVSCDEFFPRRVTRHVARHVAPLFLCVSEGETGGRRSRRKPDWFIPEFKLWLTGDTIVAGFENFFSLISLDTYSLDINLRTEMCELCFKYIYFYIYIYNNPIWNSGVQIHIYLFLCIYKCNFYI